MTALPTQVTETVSLPPSHGLLETQEKDRNIVKALPNPKVLIIIGGKRKCGKDFVGDKIIKNFNGRVMVFRIAEPIKTAFARINNIELADLMSAHPLKEQYRRQMVKWSQEIRERDPYYFNRLSIGMHKDDAKRPIWMLNDARRHCDMDYFLDANEFPQGAKIIRIKVDATLESRKQRGFVYTPGIDDQTSECGLDDFSDWDYIVDNNDEHLLESYLENIFDDVFEALKKHDF